MKSKSLKGFSSKEVLNSLDKQTSLKRFFAKQFYVHHNLCEKKRKYINVGTHVKRQLKTNLFRKSYLPKYEDKIFVVTKIKHSSPEQYFLDNGNIPYYAYQLQIVKNTEESDREGFYIAEKRKINPKKTRSGNNYNVQYEYLLRNKQFPGQAGEWISESEKESLQSKSILKTD